MVAVFAEYFRVVTVDFVFGKSTVTYEWNCFAFFTRWGYGTRFLDVLYILDVVIETSC